MPAQHVGSNLLQLRWNVPQPKVADFEAWYDEEHLADMVAVPGILGGRRFARVATGFSSPTEFGFVTLYELADLEPMRRPEFQRLVEAPSPWTRRVAFDLELARTVYRRLGPLPGHGEVPGPGEQDVAGERRETGSALLHVMMSAEPSVLEDFHGWYDEEHLPALLGVPGVLGARRFQTADDGAGFGRHESEAGLDFLAVYELADTGVVDTAAFRAAGSATPRRERLGDAVRAHVQVYRQVFPAKGALE
ncbi:hypothetical protein ACRYCC_41750 [Actinomadura scrupuli]|uniref:hypothetical protein n=1 Tax=Actinomadura scrupuli TaxID=559629 RepID=UPI003D96E709